jgi:protein gp37
MGTKTHIEWTRGDDGVEGSTWNPVGGCSVVSPGCHRCYARAVAARFSGPGKPYHGLAVVTEHGPQWTGDVRLVEKHLLDPIRWSRPRRIFCNSMSDLFHEGFTPEQIAQVFAVTVLAPRHTYQILTKRAGRMRELMNSDAFKCLVRDEVNKLCERFRKSWRWNENEVPGPPHLWPIASVWLGVSVEDQKRADERLPELVRTHAAVRFVSYEPALGPVDFGPWLWMGRPLDQIIIGGESGPGARPFDIAWARDVVRQCQTSRTSCFVKQMGSNAHDSARSIVGGWEPGDLEPDTRVRFCDRKGGDMMEWPAELRVREFPQVSGNV